jgi:hypothetical protein
MAKTGLAISAEEPTVSKTTFLRKCCGNVHPVYIHRTQLLGCRKFKKKKRRLKKKLLK